MNEDLKTRIKELKEELELLEKATEKVVSHSDEGSHIVIGTEFNAVQMALLCYMTGIDSAKAHKGINELVDKFSKDFTQMLLEQADNVESAFVEEDE